MSRSEVESTLNRHLKFKERRILARLRYPVNRNERVNPDPKYGDACFEMERKAANAVLFGILGLIIAGIIFGIQVIVAGSNAQKYMPTIILTAAMPGTRTAKELWVSCLVSSILSVPSSLSR